MITSLWEWCVSSAIDVEVWTGTGKATGDGWIAVELFRGLRYRIVIKQTWPAQFCSGTSYHRYKTHNTHQLIVLLVHAIKSTKMLLWWSKKMATTLSLAKSWLLCNLCHSTNVSLLKYIVELVLSYPSLCLQGHPTHLLWRAICWKVTVPATVPVQAISI